MKLTSSQKAILKTVDSKKKRKNAKAEFKLINRLKEMFENQDFQIHSLFNKSIDDIKVNYEYVCPEQSKCSILKELVYANPTDTNLGREVRRLFS